MSALTSPVKRRLPITQHRQGLSQQLEILDAISPSPAFVAEHLRRPPEELHREISHSVKGAIGTFMTNKSESLGYTLVCGMLNTISRRIHKNLGLPLGERLVFIDHHSSALQHHPCPDTNAQPDIVAMTQSRCRRVPKMYIKTIHRHKKYSQVPWHFGDSVGEVKPVRDSKGSSQVAAYAGLLNQARPDKPGSYCISLSPRQYRVLWSDPSGLYSTEDCQWDDVGPLISYVFSLYNPPQDHIKLDPTVTLDTRRHFRVSPRWTIDFQGKVHRHCRVIFVGSPWTRQSWIAVSDSNVDRRIIKDQYQSEGRRYDEGELFDKLQQDLSDGGAPGCVHVECHGAVEGIQTPIPATRRRKKRLVMTTVGESLYHCKSVFDFLKVMYDALEVHRWILVAKHILHRDISINNILLSNAQLPESQVPGIYPQPKFIEEVLDPNNVRAHSTALLCDFDNACIYQSQSSTELSQSRSTLETDKEANGDEVRRAFQELKNRTGTPAFIARSVAKGEVLRLRMPPPSMPTLEGDAKTAYELVHDSDPFRCYEDPEDLGHGGKMISKKVFNGMKSATGASSWTGRFFHQPMHDAESAFWVIVAFLLRACPIDNTEDAGNSQHRACLRTPVVECEMNEENGSSNEDEDEDGDGDGDEDGDSDSDFDCDEDCHGHSDVDGDENADADEGQDVGNGGNKKGDKSMLDAAHRKLDEVWQLLAGHSIRESGVDGRDAMFQFHIARWQDVLHPKLSFLAPMLEVMCEQVQPEYSLVTPAPQELHLHEALQRILLTYIWNMKNSDHVLLDQKLRPVTIYRYDVRVNTVEPLSFGSKRLRNDDEVLTEQGKKKQKH